MCVSWYECGTITKCAFEELEKKLCARCNWRGTIPCLACVPVYAVRRYRSCETVAVIRSVMEASSLRVTGPSRSLALPLERGGGYSTEHCGNAGDRKTVRETWTSADYTSDFTLQPLV